MPYKINNNASRWWSPRKGWTSWKEATRYPTMGVAERAYALAEDAGHKPVGIHDTASGEPPWSRKRRRPKRALMLSNPETGADTDQPLGWLVPADDRLAAQVIDAKVGDDDGRSEWYWLRLQNGDLMLACFPCGDTYLATEADPQRP